MQEAIVLINKCRGTCDYELEDSMCKDLNSFKDFLKLIYRFSHNSNQNFNEGYVCMYAYVFGT